ncbi:hypothetical protein BB561_005070 [Smittium simulii]|uniref:Major facilitator superfamily (MFS) profile domain-containing protein n=1 Tax=Smittium simulii TaxID=133385 RepID=A0A2T9YCF9_9FUNG|nr:hypothetical protein BB561_005070 [Smittium simulii]
MDTNYSDNDIEKGNQINELKELTEEEALIMKSSLKKRDLHILPIIILLYIAALMDRSNIGSALVNGLVSGLKLNKTQEGNVTSMFYVFYILFETPSNILLKKVSPHVWFAFIGVAWSVCCIILGIVKNGTAFVIVRCFMGVFEAGFTPGVVGYLAYWYTRSEIGYRMAIFFSAVPISGIIGAPLAGLFASIKLGSLLPFQNIFILEGALTFVLCCAAFFIIKDYPDQAKFFTKDEYDLTVSRIRADQGLASKTKVSLSITLRTIADWKLWVFSILFLGYNNAYIVLGIFSPTLIKSFGYNNLTSTYLAVIPNACGLFGVMTVLLLLNKRNYISLMIIFAAITIASYSAAVFYRNKTSSLIFLGIAGFGAMGNIPLSLAWMSINQGGIYKGMIASALVVSIGSISGVGSPKTFTSNFSTKYTLGNSIYIGGVAFSTILVVLLGIYFNSENKRRDQNPEDVSHLSEDEQRAMNDKHPKFRYIL